MELKDINKERERIQSLETQLRDATTDQQKDIVVAKFVEVLEPSRTRMLGKARSYIKHSLKPECMADAEYIVNGIFIECIENFKIGKYRSYTHPHYLHTRVQPRCVDYFRKQKPELSMQEESVQEAVGDKAEEYSENKILLKIALDYCLLKVLNLRERYVITEVYIREAEKVKVAKIINSSHTSVRDICTRSLVKLRKCLKEFGFEGSSDG